MKNRRTKSDNKLKGKNQPQQPAEAVRYSTGEKGSSVAKPQRELRAKVSFQKDDYEVMDVDVGQQDIYEETY